MPFSPEMTVPLCALEILGFAPGETVTCVLKGKNGAMSAYLVRCAVIALREKNAVEILVSQ